TVEAAIQPGVPVVMFGQGMGPLNDAAVLSEGRAVLPAVNLITLRGSSGGLELLESMGVSQKSVMTTGDEAVELAYTARTREVGSAVGISLRVASYADVAADVVGSIGTVVQEFARTHAVPLLPVPIAFHDWASDHKTIQRLLAGFDDASDGGRSLDTPL